MGDNPASFKSICSTRERHNEDVNHESSVNLANDEECINFLHGDLENALEFSDLLKSRSIYPCDICEENVATSSLLKTHKSVHRKEIVSVFSSYLNNPNRVACKPCSLIKNNLATDIVELEDMSNQVLSDRSRKFYETVLYDNAVKTLQSHNVDAISCPLYTKIMEITKSYNCDDYGKKCCNIDNLNKLNCPGRTEKSKKHRSCDKSNKDAKYKNLNDKKWRKISIANKKRKYEAAHLDNANNNVESLSQFQNASDNSVCNDGNDNEHEAELQQTRFKDESVVNDKIIIEHPELDLSREEPIKLLDSCLYEDVKQLGILDVDLERKVFDDEFLSNLTPFADENKNDLRNACLSFKTNKILINAESNEQLEQLSNVNIVEQSSSVSGECTENLRIKNNCENELQCGFEVDNRKTLKGILDKIKLEVEDKDEVINVDYPEMVDVHDMVVTNDYVTFNTNNSSTGGTAVFYTKDSNGAPFTNIESAGDLQPISDDFDEVKLDIEVVKNEIRQADYSEMSFNSIEEAHEFLKSEGLELNNEVWQLTGETNSFVEHLFSKEENIAGNEDVTNKTLKKDSIKGQLSTKAKIDVLANIKVPHGVLSNDFAQEISPRLGETFNEMVVVDILTKVQQAISVDGAELFQTCSKDNPSFLALSNEIKPSPENILSGQGEEIKELNILKGPKSNDLPTTIPVLVVYEGSKRTRALKSDTHASIINYLKATTDCLEAYLLLDNDEQHSLLKFVNEDAFKVKVRKTKKIVPGEPFIFKNSDFFVWHGNKRDATTREYNLKRILNYPHQQHNNTFSCGMCRSKHADRIAFVRHLWFHAKAKPFKCEITRSTSKMSRHAEQYVRCLVDTPMAIIPKEAKDALQFYRRKHTRLLPYMVLTDKPRFLRQMKSQTLTVSNPQRVLDVWRQVWRSDQLERAGIFRSVLDGIDEPFSILSNQIKVNKSEKKIKDVFVLLGADFDAYRSSLPVLVVHSVLYSKEYAHILKGMVLDEVNGNILNEIKTITRWTDGYLVFPGLETETSNYVDNQTITFKRINLKNSLQCRLCLKVINRQSAFYHGRTINNACVH